MNKKWNDKHLERCYKIAKANAFRSTWNYSDKDFENLYLNDLKTSSSRFSRMISLAYNRGILMGIKIADDLKNKIKLGDY